MIRRIVVSVLATLALTSFCAAEAQPPAKVPRVGVLLTASRSATTARVDRLRQGLRELGYVEGQNIAVEYRYAEGKVDRLPGLAAELVRLNVDVTVVGGTTATRAAKQASKTIPIVMTNVSDPVAEGFVASLARPGGNVTGLTALAAELGGKRLELLREIVPELSRVAVLANPDIPSYGPQMKEIEVAARTLGLQLQPVDVRGPDDLESAFSAVTRGRAGAVIGLAGPGFITLRGRIAALAVKSRLPTVYVDSDFVEAGGLVSYGPSYTDLYRQAATFVDKILKGAKPADLPVEQPTKFELVINLKTAKQIGLTVPQSVLYRADRVIE